MVSDYEIDDQPEPAPVFSFERAVNSQNVTDMIDSQKLQDIAMLAVREFDIDEGDFAERRKRIEDLYRLALQPIEKKDYPFAGASNIKYPLLTKAAMGFAAMAYPAIVKDSTVVKGKIIGSDEGQEEITGADGNPLVDKDTGEVLRKNAGLKQKIADRVSSAMSMQVLEEMECWEDDMDKILHIIPIIGCAFKKTYRDSGERKSVSKLVLPQFLIINKDAKNVESAHRVSELIQLYPYEIQEMINLGVFRDFDYTTSSETLADNYTDSDGAAKTQDDDMPHVFIEQHRRLDLDDDGYAEPYIVWIHKQSKEIVRILARYDLDDIEMNGADVVRIKGQAYYEDFPFFPDPEGGPYGIGFGHLLQHMNIAINTSVNMIIDQGHMATIGGGFLGEGVRIKSGNLKFRPNEWKRVKTGGQPLRDNVVPLPVKEPSVVLMSMMQFLIENAEEMASLSRFMAGDIPANMPATTALASIEQGMQAFKAIFKRLHRSLKKEYKRLFYLNQKHLSQEDYVRLLGDPNADVERDFMSGAVDVIPVSDPDYVSDIQSQIRAGLLMELKDDPLMDGVAIRKRALKAMGIKDVDDLVRIPPQSVDELAEAQKAALQAQIDDLNHQAIMREKEFALKVMKEEAAVLKLKADAVLSIARAESEEQGQDFAIYEAHLNELTQMKKDLGNDRTDNNRTDNNPRGMGAVEDQPNNL